MRLASGVAGTPRFIHPFCQTPELRPVFPTPDNMKEPSIHLTEIRGALVLVIENSGSGQSLLRVFDTRKSEGLVRIASSTIGEGEVLLRPV